MSLLDPYALLAGMPHLTLEVCRLADDEMGRWVPKRQAILLDDRLDQAERRCTLVHELIHHLSGDHDLAAPELGAAQERLCRDRAARVLISMTALLDAMLWSDEADEIADQLWVDEATLWDRLENLTPEESAYLTREMRERREHVA